MVFMPWVQALLPLVMTVLSALYSVKSDACQPLWVSGWDFHSRASMALVYISIHFMAEWERVVSSQVP